MITGVCTLHIRYKNVVKCIYLLVRAICSLTSYHARSLSAKINNKATGMKYLCQEFCSFVFIVLTTRAGVAAVSSCSEMSLCTTDAGATGICVNGVCVDRIEPETRHGLTFVITAKYPVATLQVCINLVRRYIGWQQ